MLASLLSTTTLGLTSEPVSVEVDCARGMTELRIVGLGDTSIQESRERIRPALKNSGYPLSPGRKYIVNLAPADLRKFGPRFDLPIALGILMATGQVGLTTEDLGDTIFIGELGLDGALRHVSGVLPVVLAARAMGKRRIVVPRENGPEASLISGVTVIAPSTLCETIDILEGRLQVPPIVHPDTRNDDAPCDCAVDFADIRGQQQAKRALEIAAAGGHNILMSGVPGSGKTLLAKALRGILPPLSHEEALEVTQIYSVANLLPRGIPLLHERPFRCVHHTASGVSIVGGGRIPGPGEISLAHHGVLFLDELTEFPAAVLEVLRQPLEDRTITITRANGTVTYPASFLLIAAMNPPAFSARKSSTRISAPLLDRIDLTVDVQAVAIADLGKRGGKDHPESSGIVRERVAEARERELRRLRGRGITVNAQMGVRDLEELCPLDTPSEELLASAVRRLSLSARAYHRTIKVARTIADLDLADDIAVAHIAEALQYRQGVGVGE